MNFFAYVDSVGKPLTETNAYLYTGSNPVNRIDPSGLWYIDLNLSLGWGVGLTGGVLINPQGMWPYLGGGGMSPPGGLSITWSPGDPCHGLNSGLQAGALIGFQRGYSVRSHDWFWEIGFMTPGYSLTGYYVWGPINNNTGP